jgi:hypothetical protein
MKPKSKKILVERIILSILAFSIGSMLFLSSCGKEKDPNKLLETDPIPAMKASNAERDSILDELLATFEEIDANLEVIREKEADLREWAEGEEVMGSREDRMVRDIQVINTLMADNRHEIGSLRERLRKAGININSLETRLNHMEIESQQKTAELQDLKLELMDAMTSLAGLNDTLTQRELRVVMQEEVISTQSAVIREQDGLMHEAYVATGSYKDLKARGLVSKKGALLGVLGGDKEFTAKTDPDEFVQIDQREHAKIPVSSKKVELITPHPDGSYTLEKGNDGKVEAIEIVDPAAFWQSSRYLIVATDQ